MAPSEAKRLTLSEALFYLAPERRVKHACRAMNAVDEDGRILTPEELCQKHADDMAARRKYFTGSESIELTEAELATPAGPQRQETPEEITGWDYKHGVEGKPNEAPANARRTRR